MCKNFIHKFDIRDPKERERERSTARMNEILWDLHQISSSDFFLLSSKTKERKVCNTEFSEDSQPTSDYDR